MGFAGSGRRCKEGGRIGEVKLDGVLRKSQMLRNFPQADFLGVSWREGDFAAVIVRLV